jgi:alpha/beta superfamily hydrolase
MEEMAVRFWSGELLLEGLIARPATGQARGAIVCHPHPQYGGSMHNNVVEAILQAMWARAITTLRFNFRGVGESQGSFDGGRGEVADTIAAIEFLGSQAEVKRGAIIAAGYSFGAIVGLRAGGSAVSVNDLIAVAPPIALLDLGSLKGSQKRIGLIVADADDYCPADRLRAIHNQIGDKARLKVIEGTNHFFGGFEAEVTGAILEML